MFKTQFDRCERVQYSSDKPTLTEQSHKHACDINNIMKKYERTRVLEHQNRYSAQYGDFTSYDDYQSALQRISDANDAFMSLPADLRKRFHNNPGHYFDFVTDPANQEELVSLGLLPAQKREETPVSEPEIQEKI